MIENPNQNIERVNTEMKDLVAQTKLGLLYAIIDLELRLKHGWGEHIRDNAKHALDVANQRPDSDSSKSRYLERAQQMISSAGGWEEKAQATLKFFNDVQEGKLPENWSEIPSWSIHGYPYEGIYRHGVVRHQTDAMRLNVQNMSEEEAVKAITNEIIKYNDFLKNRVQ